MSVGLHRSTPKEQEFLICRQGNSRYKFCDMQSVGQELSKAVSWTQGDSPSPLKLSTDLYRTKFSGPVLSTTCLDSTNEFLHQIYSCFHLQLLPKFRSWPTLGSLGQTVQTVWLADLVHSSTLTYFATTFRPHTE